MKRSCPLLDHDAHALCSTYKSNQASTHEEEEGLLSKRLDTIMGTRRPRGVGRGANTDNNDGSVASSSLGTTAAVGTVASSSENNGSKTTYIRRGGRRISGSSSRINREAADRIPESYVFATRHHSLTRNTLGNTDYNFIVVASALLSASFLTLGTEFP